MLKVAGLGTSWIVNKLVRRFRHLVSAWCIGGMVVWVTWPSLEYRCQLIALVSSSSCGVCCLICSRVSGLLLVAGIDAYYIYYYYCTRLTASFPWQPGSAGTRKVKPIWILLKQETVSGSGISRAIMQVCTLLQTDSHTSTPPLSFLQAGCPFCRPTNSIKALKANT